MVQSGISFIIHNGQLTHRSPISLPSYDTKLEFVSDLHQCSPMQALKSEVSISAKDIANFLLSRHGIAISAAQVRGVVLRGLTENYYNKGSESEDSGSNVLDLLELLFLLIIHNLLRIIQSFMTVTFLSCWGVETINVGLRHYG